MRERDDVGDSDQPFFRQRPSGLLPQTQDLVGGLLRITPGYGYGWRDGSNNQHVDYRAIHDAGPFRARLHSLWEWRGPLRGGIARVEHAGHPFDALWIVFYTMTVGMWELNGQSAPRINIELGIEEPTFDEGWPRIRSGEPRIHGYVRVEPILHDVPQTDRR